MGYNLITHFIKKFTEIQYSIQLNGYIDGNKPFILQMSLSVIEFQFRPHLTIK